MKPARFTYYAPESLDETLSLLSNLDDDAKVLAGGQSLVPMMNLRLARPSALIDLARVVGLDRIERNERYVHIGCMARYTDVARALEIRTSVPLLADTIRYVGHPAIRNRGTLGGSLAHADPAAQGPLIAVALEADLVVRSTRGRRLVPAGEFFQGPFLTALDHDELLVEARFPVAVEHEGWGYRQVARAHGDFALVAAACVVRLEGDICREVRVGVCGAGPRPIRVVDAEAAVVGHEATDLEARRRAVQIVCDTVTPTGDVHASSDYRRKVAGVLTGRVLDDAAKRALAQGRD